MAIQTVPIEGSLIEWARQEAGYTPDELAVKLAKSADDIRSWESGQSYPTRGEFTKLAKALKRPSAMFFLPAPPDRGNISVSLRSAPTLGGHRLGPQELLAIRRARRLQEVASWALEDGGSDPNNLPHYDPGRDPSSVGEAQRRRSGVSFEAQLGWGDVYKAFRSWRSLLEGSGMLVFQATLGKSGIRGFGVWDAYAPLVVVNSAYHPTARIFTLFHELGHLLTRTNAACYGFRDPASHDVEYERWCERFSASYLIPPAALRFEARAQGIDEHSVTEDPDKARRLANRFKVSIRAMAIRLRTLGLAGPGLYGAVVDAFAASDWNPKGGGGGGRIRAVKRRDELGDLLPDILLSAADQGRFNRRDLTDYLRLTTGEVDDFRRDLVAP